MVAITYSRPILCPVSHHATIGTHSAYGFAPRARSAAWSDVKACALLLMAFALVIGGMTAAGLR